MFKTFFLQFINFSKNYWWIYVLLSISIGIVLSTGRWNIYEVILLFLWNFLGNLCIMMMQDSYKDNKMQLGAYFLVLANVLFSWVSLYGFVVNGEVQYLLWQISFNLVGIKTFLYYVFSYDFKQINFITIGCVNTFLIFIILYFFDVNYYTILQSFWFAGVTLWLSILEDTKRYFILIFWTFILVCGNLLGIIDNFISGYILGITVSYGILTLTTFVFYIKLLPLYLKKLK